MQSGIGGRLKGVGNARAAFSELVEPRTIPPRPLARPQLMGATWMSVGNDVGPDM
jgi:hypothetical protein